MDSAWSAGNYLEAQRNANIARILNYIGLGVGIASWVVFGILLIIYIMIIASA